MIERLLDTYKSADLVIQKVKENPYTLCEVNGIGWKTADRIALAGGMGEYSTSRIESFILHYLNVQGMDGYSYIEPEELMGAIIEAIGEEVPDLSITESIHNLKNKLWWNEEKTKIGLSKYRRLEERIGEELIRLLKSPSNFKYDGWQDIIKHKEHQQGWSYTNQQIEGIKTVLENQVTVVHGLAGTGKSTIVDGILAVLKGYSFAQCALSGRASARMAEITKKEGFTIHRLLKYPCIDQGAKQMFFYHDENKLPYDVIIIDEISMIDGYIFYYLIRAIKNGAKVIILGDVGQLESIGCLNIAADLIKSEIIPTVHLTEIHRQAQSSAIITESIKVRTGSQLVSKDWVGTELRGKLQDLLIDCYSDKSNTFYKIMQYFATELEKIDNIMDLQIIVPVKDIGNACTWNINIAVQEIYNPYDPDKNEIDVFYSKDKIATLRVGDKVINTQNNYDVFLAEDCRKTSVFNGNMGIITEISDSHMVVDFIDIGKVYIPKKYFKRIELGYAITVHKSQGSQFSRLIVGIDFYSYSLLTKELLYTALTRAQENCILVAENSALRYAASREGVKYKKTHLVEVLHALANPKLIF